MCGRTSCHLPADTIRRACRYLDSYGHEQLPEWKDEDKYYPSYNKSPQSNSPVLLSRLHFEKDADPCDRIIASMRWGLIPSWVRESDASKMQFNTSNCRSETMMERRSYKVPLEKGRRCVILADGFFEWQQFRGEKQPYFIYFPQIKTEKSFFSRSVDEEVWDDWRLLTMAGIFDRWEPPNGGEPIYSYTVITVDSCKVLSDIHHRMPALLDGEEAVAKWLDFGEVPIQEALKVIHPVENITLHPVSTVVNNSLNNTPQCLEPVEIEEMPYVSPSRRKTTLYSLPKEEPDISKRSRPTVQKNLTSSKRGSAELMERWLKKHEARHKIPKIQ
ncbi:abasic site processing protein HMCES [Macrotis lagotis]|uniref:abasic site processing protein HMCES n=1 Tax=Macrotis lagotis TaxID=92651 RepID=UPI003D6913D2